MIDPEIIGSLVGGGIVAGVVVNKVWASFSHNGKCKSHCNEHENIVTTLATVERDVKWIREKHEHDSTNVLLDGILKHLVERDK